MINTIFLFKNNMGNYSSVWVKGPVEASEQVFKKYYSVNDYLYIETALDLQGYCENINSYSRFFKHLDGNNQV